MGLQVDPERNEVCALAEVASWRDRRVLEIGCGDGRLTVRLARLGARVEAIDPDAKLVRAARRALPVRYARHVRYRVAGARRLPHAAGSFDRVVFAWSL
jgi:2-polyprenyl-6-hydroxyphenyl methylase/3-demethylubiquinone-9 3-methyltransferase